MLSQKNAPLHSSSQTSLEDEEVWHETEPHASASQEPTWSHASSHTRTTSERHDPGMPIPAPPAALQKIQFTKDELRKQLEYDLKLRRDSKKQKSLNDVRPDSLLITSPLSPSLTTPSHSQTGSTTVPLEGATMMVLSPTAALPAESPAIPVSEPSSSTSSMPHPYKNAAVMENKPTDSRLQKDASCHLGYPVESDPHATFDPVSHASVTDYSLRETYTHPSSMKRSSKRVKTGTVASMRPSPVVALHQSAKVTEAAAYMAAKRQDALLITDSEGHLVGIVTDKDMTYRVVADGLLPQHTSVSLIMTQNPVSVSADDNAIEALNKMVAGHFRHLPVLEAENMPDHGGGVVGVLDITKCLYQALEKLERVHASSKKLTDAIDEVQKEFPQHSAFHYAQYLRERLGCPDLSGVLSNSTSCSGVHTPPVVSLRASVLEATLVMKEHCETAVLVLDTDERHPHIYSAQIAGIFTSKDVVLRVLAAGLDPASTAVIRQVDIVMTPHPDCVARETTVLEALRKMHVGRYLHLPVVDEQGLLEGLVDVLKLTYVTLDQLNTMTVESGEGPVWNKFWDSALMGSDVSHRSRHRQRSTASTSSQSHVYSHYARSITPTPSQRDEEESLTPEDSASAFHAIGNGFQPHRPSAHRSLPRHRMTHVTQREEEDRATWRYRQATPSHRTETTALPIDKTFVYKMKDRENNKLVHRFIASATHLADLTRVVATKMGYPAEIHLSLGYMDDEGDMVQLSCDRDLVDAVRMARTAKWKKLQLCLSDIRETVPLSTPIETSPRLIEQRSLAKPSSVLSRHSSSSLHSHRQVELPDADFVPIYDEIILEGEGGKRSRASLRETSSNTDVLIPIAISGGVLVVAAFFLGRFFAK